MKNILCIISIALFVGCNSTPDITGVYTKNADDGMSYEITHIEESKYGIHAKEKDREAYSECSFNAEARILSVHSSGTSFKFSEDSSYMYQVKDVNQKFKWYKR